MPQQGQVTQLLGRLRQGDDEALASLMPLLYDELREIARRQLHGEQSGHTLGATALVNEAYLKLVQQRQLSPADRAQFFAIASTTMRRILVDYARSRRRLKRGRGVVPVPLDEVEEFLTDDEADEVLALDAALERLEKMNPRGSKVVEHRFYGGLTLEETAEALGVSTKTVQREWTSCRAWLRKEVKGDLHFHEE